MVYESNRKTTFFSDHKTTAKDLREVTIFTQGNPNATKEATARGGS